MHDIDRVRLESEAEAFESGAFEAGPFELNEAGEVFGETENMELASELLEVSSEQELEGFLGDLVARAGHSLGQFVGSPQGQALVGVLKNAARQVLPRLGSSVGRYLGGDAGARLGAQLANAGGQAFGLELEGLSNEDREFEVARRYVDFAGQAVKNLLDSASAGQSAAGGAAARTAVDAAIAAAQTHAPGLVQVAATMKGATPAPGNGKERGRGMTGRWVRHGSTIVLFGV